MYKTILKFTNLHENNVNQKLEWPVLIATWWFVKVMNMHDQMCEGYEYARSVMHDTECTWFWRVSHPYFVRVGKDWCYIMVIRWWLFFSDGFQAGFYFYFTPAPRLLPRFYFPVHIFVKYSIWYLTVSFHMFAIPCKSWCNEAWMLTRTGAVNHDTEN